MSSRAWNAKMTLKVGPWALFAADENLMLSAALLSRVDRYVVRSFLARFLLMLCFIAGLFVTFDFLKNAGDFRETAGGLTFSHMMRYYGYLLPVFLIDLVPGIILVAAGMVLVQMAKQRELLALKACGTSIRRVTVPLFLCTALISGVVYGVRETLGPDFARKSAWLSRELEGDVERQVFLSDAHFRRKLYIATFDYAKGSMEGVTVMDFQEDGRLRRLMQASSATWAQDGTLLLRDVSLQEYDQTGAPGAKQSLPSKQLETSLQPFDIIAAADEGGGGIALFRSLPELMRMARQQPTVPYFRVAFHSRIASFFGPAVLLLVVIPCLIGFETSVNSRLLGAVICIAAAASYYTLTFVLTSMGNSNTISAFLAGWLPAGTAAVAGARLFWSMLT